MNTGSSLGLAVGVPSIFKSQRNFKLNVKRRAWSPWRKDKEDEEVLEVWDDDTI
jgi:hypothetical protein